MNRNKKEPRLLAFLPPSLSKTLEIILKENPQIHELRLRREQPVILTGAGSTYFLNRFGSLSVSPDEAWIVSAEDICFVFSALCHYSVYSYQQNLIEGFLTLEDGSRVGIGGSAVVKNGEISSVKDVSSLNFRIAATPHTCAAEVLDALHARAFPSTIIIGAPCSGKTTLLRELCRLLSSGYGGNYQKCVIIDERGELAALGTKGFGFDVGINTDVLSFYPKAKGIIHAIRALSPDWIFADEIGTPEEARSVLHGLNSGVRFFLSLHADTVQAAFRREQFRLLHESGEIKAGVLLGSGSQLGQVKEIVDL